MTEHMPNGLKRDQWARFRVDTGELFDIDLAAANLEIDRSSFLRQSAAFMATAVNDATYAARLIELATAPPSQIGTDILTAPYASPVSPEARIAPSHPSIESTNRP